MADDKIVGLDIGTSVIRVAIGEIDPETGNIQIAGTASRKSAGLRNGVIVNIEDAKNAIKVLGGTIEKIDKFNFFLKQIQDFEKVFPYSRAEDIIIQLENSIISVS